MLEGERANILHLNAYQSGQSGRKLLTVLTMAFSIIMVLLLLGVFLSMPFVNLDTTTKMVVVEEERAKCSSITVQRIYLTVDPNRLTGRPVFKWPVNFETDDFGFDPKWMRPFPPICSRRLSFENSVFFSFYLTKCKRPPKMATCNPASLNGKVLMEIDQETLDSGACG